MQPEELKDVEYPECTSSCSLFRSYYKDYFITQENVKARLQSCILSCRHKFVKEEPLEIKTLGPYKVYCNECKHLHYCLDTFYCYHPDNYTKKGNWKDKNALVGAKEPSEINKYNNCKWFKKKEE
jgi:hypothetical protein